MLGIKIDRHSLRTWTKLHSDDPGINRHLTCTKARIVVGVLLSAKRVTTKKNKEGVRERERERERGGGGREIDMANNTGCIVSWTAASSPASNNPFGVAASERLLARILARAIPRTFGNAGASGRRDGGRPGLAGWQAGEGRHPFALSPPDEFRLYARPDVT